METNFVLAFGGTGARCLEALGYLYASRCIRNPARVLLIDPDHQNGNGTHALDQFERYQAIHAAVGEGPDDGQAFFATLLNPGGGRESFLWSYPNPNLSFASLIKHVALHPDQQRALSLFYTQSDLDLIFERGYHGRASIGSLDMYRTLKAGLQPQTSQPAGAQGPPDSLQEFMGALRQAAQANPRVRLMVLGSVFGGTGASAIPLIPRLVREQIGNLADRIDFGVVLMAPYFVFGTPVDLELDPDSTDHPLATQIALHYYAHTDAGYSRPYVIGAPERHLTNPQNAAGGTNQDNDAHYAELDAALATADFFSDSPQTTLPKQVAASGSAHSVWAGLPAPQTAQAQRNLASFATFCLMHSGYLYPRLSSGRHTDAKWLLDLQKAVGRPLRQTEPELATLSDYAQRFLRWASQVQNSTGTRPDAPDSLFSIPPSLQESELREQFLAHVVPGARTDAFAYDGVYSRLNKARPIGNQHCRTPGGWYVAALAASTDEYCAATHDWWRKA